MRRVRHLTSSSPRAKHFPGAVGLCARNPHMLSTPVAGILRTLTTSDANKIRRGHDARATWELGYKPTGRMGDKFSNRLVTRSLQQGHVEFKPFPSSVTSLSRFAFVIGGASRICFFSLRLAFRYRSPPALIRSRLASMLSRLLSRSEYQLRFGCTQ